MNTASSKTIEITVSPTGQSSIETKGFAGTECRDASKFLERALGLPGTEQLKAEFHQVTQSQNQQQSAS